MESNTSATIASVWKDKFPEGESLEQPITTANGPTIRPKLVVSAPSATMSEQNEQYQVEGTLIFDKCCLRYAVPPQWIAYEWAGMFNMFCFLGIIMSIAFLFSTIYTSAVFRNEFKKSSDSEGFLHHLMPGFNSILAFGLLASLLTLFAALAAIFAAHHARKRFNAALIICSFCHIGLLTVSTLFLMAVSISVFVIGGGAPMATKNALGMIISSMLVVGIPMQTIFICMELYLLFVKTKINYWFGRQPKADVF